MLFVVIGALSWFAWIRPRFGLAFSWASFLLILTNAEFVFWGRSVMLEAPALALMILKKMGLSTEQVRLEIERNLPGGGTTMTFGEIPFSPRVKKVIEYGVEEARLLGHNHIGSEHLLLGLLREEEGIGGKILRSLGANLLTARQLTVTFLRKSAPRERDRKWANFDSAAGWA